MKTTIRLLRAAVSGAVALAAAGAVHAADPSSVKLQVNGMVCAFCAQGIEKRLKALDAAGPLYINLSQKVVAVEAQPGRTLDVERIRAEVRDAGYEVVDAQVVPQTVAQIRDEMRGRR